MALRHTLGMRLGALTLLTSAFAMVPAASPAAVPAAPDITVSITHLSPATLPNTGNITIAGSVRNGNKHDWRNAIVHVLAPRSPFVDHSQAREAIAGGTPYTGSPIDARNAIEELGTLRAGDSERFSITIRRSQLPVSGADGVYPLGIDVVADNADETRGRTSIGRAATFLPALETNATPTQTVVLWPFLLTGTRRSDGSFADEAGLLKDIGPRGRLRNLLTLVRSTPKLGSDALLDPSLFAVLKDMADRPAKTDAERSRRDLADDFLDDLTHLADGYSCASTGYDRPDWLAIARSSATERLAEAVDQATDGTLDSRDIECTRVEWPTGRGTSRPVLNDLHAAGTQAVILSKSTLPDWQSTTGSLLDVQTQSGAQPVIVYDPLDAGLPGQPTVVGLRQVILSEAVFGSIAAKSTKERHPVIIIVNPHLNPGTVHGSPLEPALGTEVVDRKNLARTLRSEPARYAGAIPSSLGVTPVSPRQIAEAVDADKSSVLLNSMLVESDDRDEHSQLVASLLSQRWRGHPHIGLAAARHASKLVNQELAAISVEGPRALTLSSRSGRFPISVQNHTPHEVRVGIDIESSATGVTFEAPKSVRVSAGESRTTTVNMNMDGQTATTVSVRLSAGDNASFGASTVFNVRSSRVGAALWIAIAISVAFVAIALVRRFGRPGHEPPHPTLSPSDFDD